METGLRPASSVRPTVGMGACRRRVWLCPLQSPQGSIGRFTAAPQGSDGPGVRGGGRGRPTQAMRGSPEPTPSGSSGSSVSSWGLSVVFEMYANTGRADGRTGSGAGGLAPPESTRWAPPPGHHGGRHCGHHPRAPLWAPPASNTAGTTRRAPLWAPPGRQPEGLLTLGLFPAFKENIRALPAWPGLLPVRRASCLRTPRVHLFLRQRGVSG